MRTGSRFRSLLWLVSATTLEAWSSTPTSEGIISSEQSSLCTSPAWSRRTVLQTSAFMAGIVLPTTVALQACAFDTPTAASRSGDIGGGIDISLDTSNQVLSDPPDVVFPLPYAGRWACQRTIVSIEGDQYQAQAAYKALGGSTEHFPKTIENFETKLIPAPFNSDNYAVVDRTSERSSRTGTSSKNIQWNINQPNVLQSGDSNTKLTVIQRSVTIPSLNQGVLAGSQELVRIQEGPFTRAALVKQRYRPSPSDPNLIEGLEILKTFRVLDGIAGTEFPTSTIKSQILLTRL